MFSNDSKSIRRIVALLRITLGLIILFTWYENLQKGVYTAEGIEGLFNYIFNDNAGGPGWYQAIIQNTILQQPGAFARFQMVGEFLFGLGLLIGGLTPIAGGLATLFFFNLFLAYFGGSEWIWTYVLLTVSALTVTLARSGRALGLDQLLLARRGEPRYPFLW